MTKAFKRISKKERHESFTVVSFFTHWHSTCWVHFQEQLRKSWVCGVFMAQQHNYKEE